MIYLRKANERGHANHGWLDSWHTFSFANYYDPNFMGFSALRVINDDVIDAGQGFGTHPHKDMEILTYVLEGAVEHQDSMGNIESIQPGEVQRMSAGTGVRHSEFNHAKAQTTHLLQIWIQPSVQAVTPSYQQKSFAVADKQGRLCQIASADGAQGSLSMNADARLYAGLFDEGQSATLALQPGRRAYVFLVRGQLAVNSLALGQGDAALLADEAAVLLTNAVSAEVLVFDLSA